MMNYPPTLPKSPIRFAAPRRSYLALILTGLVLAGCATPTQLMLDAEVESLCAQDGGVRVFEQVPVSVKAANLNEKKYVKPGDKYYFEIEQQTLKRKGYLDSGGYSLDRSVTRIYRIEDGKLLGQRIAYSRSGADIPGPWHPSSFTCPPLNPENILSNRVFTGAANQP